MLWEDSEKEDARPHTWDRAPFCRFQGLFQNHSDNPELKAFREQVQDKEEGIAVYAVQKAGTPGGEGLQA